MELYRAVDTLDGVLSLFLVEGERMCVSSDTGAGDEWLDRHHLDFDDWLSGPLEWDRMQDKERVW